MNECGKRKCFVHPNCLTDQQRPTGKNEKVHVPAKFIGVEAVGLSLSNYCF